jgi:hypothetical protein
MRLLCFSKSVRQLALGCFLAFGALPACGGSTPPAESAAGESEAPAESGTEPAAGESEAPAAGGAGESASAAKDDTPASADDLKTVLQLVLDDETLDPFLHLDQPGRFPLAVSGPNLPEGLMKSSKPVKIVAQPGSKKDPVLVFTEIDVKGKHATVRFRYDIEGIQGSAVLDKRDHGWELTRSKVIER